MGLGVKVRAWGVPRLGVSRRVGVTTTHIQARAGVRVSCWIRARVRVSCRIRARARGRVGVGGARPAFALHSLLIAADKTRATYCRGGIRGGVKVEVAVRVAMHRVRAEGPEQRARVGPLAAAPPLESSLPLPRSLSLPLPRSLSLPLPRSLRRTSKRIEYLLSHPTDHTPTLTSSSSSCAGTSKVTRNDPAISATGYPASINAFSSSHLGGAQSSSSGIGSGLGLGSWLGPGSGLGLFVYVGLGLGLVVVRVRVRVRVWVGSHGS